MCREWVQLLKISPCRLNETRLGFLRRAGWDRAQQTTSKTLSEILLFQCKPEIKVFEKIIDTLERGSFLAQWNPPSSASFWAPSQAMHSVDTHHRWIHNVIMRKGVGTSMYTTNQMCPIDQTSFSCIFLAAIPNSNDYFRKELSDSYPGDSKLSNLSEQISIYGEGGVCVCEKFRTNDCVWNASRARASSGSAGVGELTWQRGAIKS